MNTVTIRLSTTGSETLERNCGVAFTISDKNDTFNITEEWVAPKMKRQSATIKGLMEVFKKLNYYRVFYQETEGEEVMVDIMINYPEIVYIMKSGLSSPLLSLMYRKDEVYNMIEKEIKELNDKGLKIRLFSGEDKATFRMATKVKIQYQKQLTMEERYNEFNSRVEQQSEISSRA